MIDTEIETGTESEIESEFEDDVVAKGPNRVHS